MSKGNVWKMKINILLQENLLPPNATEKTKQSQQLLNHKAGKQNSGNLSC